MAFSLPTFNLKVSIYRNGGIGGTYGVPDLGPFANLSPGRRVMIGISAGDLASNVPNTMELLLPASTDIRAPWNGGNGDLVECPINTKRFYLVEFVDDIGKGFANEHRYAVIRYQVSGNTTLIGGPFPAPKPLP